MSQNSTATTEAATDFEAVSHQLAALRTDSSRLAVRDFSAVWHRTSKVDSLSTL